MFLGHSTMQLLRRAALVLGPVLVAVFAAVAFHNPKSDLWAQGTKPTPPSTSQPAAKPPAEAQAHAVAVQKLVSLRTDFLADLNQAIRDPKALTQGRAKVVVLVDHKVWRDIVEDRAIVVISSAKTVQLSQAELQSFHDHLASQIDQAIKLEQAGKGGARALGEGTYQNHVFSGKLRTVAP
jgi:hypothetical protein